MLHACPGEELVALVHRSDFPESNARARHECGSNIRHIENVRTYQSVSGSRRCVRLRKVRGYRK